MARLARLGLESTRSVPQSSSFSLPASGRDQKLEARLNMSFKPFLLHCTSREVAHHFAYRDAAIYPELGGIDGVIGPPACG
jgi:hypothetical protein